MNWLINDAVRFVIARLILVLGVVLDVWQRILGRLLARQQCPHLNTRRLRVSHKNTAPRAQYRHFID